MHIMSALLWTFFVIPHLCIAKVTHGVCVDDRCPTTSYHRPDAALGIQDGQFEGCTCGSSLIV
jgi:hypothetical protein